MAGRVGRAPCLAPGLNIRQPNPPFSSTLACARCIILHQPEVMAPTSFLDNPMSCWQSCSSQFSAAPPLLLQSCSGVASFTVCQPIRERTPGEHPRGMPLDHHTHSRFKASRCGELLICWQAANSADSRHPQVQTALQKRAPCIIEEDAVDQRRGGRCRLASGCQPANHKGQHCECPTGTDRTAHRSRKVCCSCHRLLGRRVSAPGRGTACCT